MYMYKLGYEKAFVMPGNELLYDKPLFSHKKRSFFKNELDFLRMEKYLKKQTNKKIQRKRVVQY